MKVALKMNEKVKSSIAPSLLTNKQTAKQWPQTETKKKQHIDITIHYANKCQLHCINYYIPLKTLR